MSESKNNIVIDKDKGLVFSSEEELYKFFEADIKKLESEYLKLKKTTDISDKDYKKYENQLELTVEEPDEVWENLDQTEHKNLAVFVRFFEKEDNTHVVLAYLTNDIPSFIYLHFPTNDDDLVDHYRTGDLIYDRVYASAPLGAVEGDSLFEGDQFSRGLYEAMLKLRSEEDISESEFFDYGQFREEAIEKADEIWRSVGASGSTLVTFIKEFNYEHDDFFYISVTEEDEASSTHTLLFSFPTNDENLVERYRNGENLQAEEVIQEFSH